jgi:hypothetical protein
VPRAAARRSQVVPRSRQPGQPDEAMPRQPRRCAGRQAGAHRRSEGSPMTRSTDSYPTGRKALTVCPGGFEGSTSRALGLTGPFLQLGLASF